MSRRTTSRAVRLSVQDHSPELSASTAPVNSPHRENGTSRGEDQPQKQKITYRLRAFFGTAGGPLQDISPREIGLLRAVEARGLASADSVAVNAGRIGENLQPELESLLNRHLLEVTTIFAGGKERRLYKLAPDITLE
jgi:hypothetical protein